MHLVYENALVRIVMLSACTTQRLTEHERISKGSEGLHVLPEEALVPVPAHLDYQEAATLPCAAATAWNALDGGLALKPGDDVLTLGSGGVSILALQLTKAAVARVIATTSTDDKADRLRALAPTRW